jgi:hypothetical protein
MKENSIWVELVKKIELQSIIVLVITILTGIYLFTLKNIFPSPTSILGITLIGFGILYSFSSFFTNNIRESYKDLLAEYKTLNIELTKRYKNLSESYESQITKIQGLSTTPTEMAESKSKYKSLVEIETKTDL